MAYTIELYDGRQHPAVHACTRSRAATEREANREAARLLGHASLRGASRWDRYQGGTVYQFGPHEEDNGYDYAVVIADDDGQG
jgi:hypothetical protein